MASFPIPGDYDGDGKTDVAVYRPSTGWWIINPSTIGVPYAVAWGGDPSDIPVPGDYDQNGITDLAFYRASTETWYISPSSGGPHYGLTWGVTDDVPIAETNLY